MAVVQGNLEMVCPLTEAESRSLSAEEAAGLLAVTVVGHTCRHSKADLGRTDWEP